MSGYREFADFLNDWKCGGPREVEETSVEIGDMFYVRDIWEPRENAEIRVVDAENINWFRRMLNDPENDVVCFERIPPSSQS